MRQAGAVGRVARAAGPPFHLVVDVDGVQVLRPVAEARGVLRIEFGRQGLVVTLEAKRVGVRRERGVERRRIRRREQGDLGRRVRLVTRQAIFVLDRPMDGFGAGDFVLDARNRAPLQGDRLVVAAQAGAIGLASSRFSKSLVCGLWQARQAFPSSAMEWLDLPLAIWLCDRLVAVRAEVRNRGDQEVLGLAAVRAVAGEAVLAHRLVEDFLFVQGTVASGAKRGALAARVNWWRFPFGLWHAVHLLAAAGAWRFFSFRMSAWQAAVAHGASGLISFGASAAYAPALIATARIAAARSASAQTPALLPLGQPRKFSLFLIPFSGIVIVINNSGSRDPRRDTTGCTVHAACPGTGSSAGPGCCRGRSLGLKMIKCGYCVEPWLLWQS